MLEQVLKLVIYYISSVKDEKDQNFKECLDFIQLLENIANDDLEKFDYIVQNISETHPIKTIYANIKKSSINDYKKSLIEAKQLIELYSKKNFNDESFSKLQNEEGISILVNNIINYN